MTAYASVSDFKGRYGAARATSLVGGSDPDARILELLRGGQSTLDAALDAGGWTTPIVVADLTDDADQQTGISEKLEACTCILAFEAVISSTDLTTRAKDALASCLSFLSDLRAGGGLPAAPPVPEAVPLFAEPTQPSRSRVYNPTTFANAYARMGLR